MGICSRIRTMNNRWFNKRSLKKFNVTCGKNVTINGRIMLYGGGKITICENAIINSSIASNPTGLTDRTVLYAVSGAEIKIGYNSGISNCVIAAFQSVTIGDYVMIGTDCKIYDTDFHALDFRRRISSYRDLIPTKPTIIDDGAFIGTGSIILKGVRIGKKSIIGAGSVVTKSVPDGEIWAGNPAKFIRKISE